VTIIFFTSTLRSGTAAWRFFDAKAGPCGPWGRPAGSVWSMKLGATEAVSKLSSPVFQKVAYAVAALMVASCYAFEIEVCAISSLTFSSSDEAEPAESAAPSARAATRMTITPFPSTRPRRWRARGKKSPYRIADCGTEATASRIISTTASGAVAIGV
jgi:hypothetical protein